MFVFAVCSLLTDKMLKVDTGNDDGSQTERRGGSEQSASEVGVVGVQQDNLLQLASRSSELLQVVANELEPVQSRINDFSNYLHKFASLLQQRTSSQTLAVEYEHLLVTNTYTVLVLVVLCQWVVHLHLVS